MAAGNQTASGLADRWACGDPPGPHAVPAHPVAAVVAVVDPLPPPAAQHPQLATGAGRANHQRASSMQGVRCPICRIFQHQQQQQHPSSSGSSLLADFSTGLITGAVVGIVLIKVAQAGLRCPGTSN